LQVIYKLLELLRDDFGLNVVSLRGKKHFIPPGVGVMFLPSFSQPPTQYSSPHTAHIVHSYFHIVQMIQSNSIKTEYIILTIMISIRFRWSIQTLGGGKGKCSNY